MSQHPGASIWTGTQFPITPSASSPAPTRSAQPDPEEVQAVLGALTSALPPGHFRPSDEVLLLAFCRAAAVERKVGERMLHEPHAISLSERATYQQAVRTLDMLGSRLCLCPQSRQPRRPGRPRK
jgi:hypothetical protein